MRLTEYATEDLIREVRRRGVQIDAKDVSRASLSRVGISATIQLAIDTFLKHYGFRHSDLLGGTRRQQWVLARRALIHMLRDTFQISVSKIAELVGYSNHTSVTYQLYRDMKPFETAEFDQAMAGVYVALAGEVE